MCFFLNFACAISWPLKIRIELSVFFAILFAVDHQGLPMTRFGQSFGKEITVVNLCTNWWTTYFEVLSTQQFLGFFKKGSWPRRWFPFQERRLVGLWERKRRTWRTKAELVNWLCVAHELRLFIVWSYVVLAPNDCHRSLTRRVKPHSIWRECAISLSSEFQKWHSSKKHDQLSSWSYNCCVVVYGRFKRCLYWTFQLGNYSSGESSSL